jgi:2'-5' RNA ligase
MANTTTTIQTALCIIPPEHVWKQIQSIRSIHDRAYPRWMPHINLIYPFISEENFENIKTQLEPVLKREKPFQIQFDQSSIDYFRQRGDECTYHLRPTISTEVIRLQKLIQNHLSNVPSKKRAFEAHLTLGQTTTSKIIDVLANIKAQWQTIEFTVDRVYMISRENHPENLFTIKNEILLLDQVDESPLLAVSNLMIKSPAINDLCIMVPNGFSRRFSQLFENTSFQASKVFRITLAEYANGPVDSDLRSKLESAPKFTLIFGQDSLNFDETTSRLFLKPTNMETIHQLNVLDHTKYDGTLTLGELHSDDFEKVNDRFIKNWSADTNQFQIDRVHLVDSNDRFKFIFRLKNV